MKGKGEAGNSHGVIEVVVVVVIVVDGRGGKRRGRGRGGRGRTQDIKSRDPKDMVGKKTP